MDQSLNINCIGKILAFFQRISANLMKHTAHYAQLTVPLTVKTRDKYNLNSCFGSDREDQIMSDLFSSNLKFVTNSGIYFSPQITSVFKTLYVSGSYFYHLLLHP
jgi:hypothetical protein